MIGKCSSYIINLGKINMKSLKNSIYFDVYNEISKFKRNYIIENILN
jgi:hypothetical protein